MNNEQRKTIRKVQAVLQSIANGTPLFFNVAMYEKNELVKSVKKWGKDATGNKVEIGHTFQLTAKARRILNTTI